MTSTVSRLLITAFDLANPLYAEANVRVLEVDTATWKPTDRLAPLYGSPTSSVELSNPQRLDGDGKWRQPVYAVGPVICRVDAAKVPAHDTGIIGFQPSYAGSLATSAAAGGASALPAAPAGYIEVVIGSETYLLPVFPKP